MRLLSNTLIILCLLCAFAPFSHSAQKKTYAMSQKVFKKIEKVNAYLDEDNTVEAKALLTTLLNKKLSKYEKAQVNYMIGSIEFQQGNTAKALTVFKRVLKAEGNIPELLYIRTLKTLAQLSLLQEQLNDAKNYALTLVNSSKEKPQAENYSLLAQVYYRLAEYPATIKSINKSLKITQQKNKAPKENILLLLNAAYFEIQAFEQMIPTLEHIIKLYPKPMYMLYLASIYGQLDQPNKQTVLMESLYEDGQLNKSSQLINLANLYLSEKVPFKAATLLETAISKGQIKQNIRNLEMLSQAWMLAANHQKSIAVLSLAANQSDNGDLFFKKAYLHYNISEWKKSEESILLALDKGLDKEKNIGEAWLLMGMVRFNMGQFDKAIMACEKALKSPSSKGLALSWISYIKAEQTKYEYLINAVK